MIDLKELQEKLERLNEYTKELIKIKESIYEKMEQDYPWLGYIPPNAPDSFFVEMAEIYPKYNKKVNPKIRFHVVVPEGKEGPVPYVHVYFRHKEDKDNQYISYIDLTRCGYAPQHENECKHLNSKERKALVKFFNTYENGVYTTDKNGNPVPANCYQHALDVYIRAHDVPDNIIDKLERDENGLFVMPNYIEL